MPVNLKAHGQKCMNDAYHAFRLVACVSSHVRRYYHQNKEKDLIISILS